MREKGKIPKLILYSTMKGFYNRVKEHPNYAELKKIFKDNS